MIFKTHTIIVAHLDDIEFGLINYINFNIKPKDLVNIYIASSGLGKHSSSINYNRFEIQLKNLNILFNFLEKDNLNIEIASDQIDTLFYENKKTIRNLLENWIKKNVKIPEKNILITLAPDINEDHRIISELCDVISRPKLDNLEASIFKEYYKFYIPDNYTYMKNYNIGAQYLLNNKQFNNITKYKLTKDNIILKKLLLQNYPISIIKFDISVSNQEIIIKIF